MSSEDEARKYLFKAQNKKLEVITNGLFIRGHIRFVKNPDYELSKKYHKDRFP